MSGNRLYQRIDYTGKFNRDAGRHGWLRLTPAYSVRVVEGLLRGRVPLRVLDPFCGTATTALCAAHHGSDAVTMDINPFLVWFGSAKTARYPDDVIRGARSACPGILEAVESGAAGPAPPIRNIDRWWGRDALKFLRGLKAGIEMHTDSDSGMRNLLLVAFCRTLIGLSNAAFNHQSMSFGDGSRHTRPDMRGRFTDDVNFVLEGAGKNPCGTARVLSGDARDMSGVAGQFDMVVTSPPYANRMSYVRELRPYMYWLGFLDGGRAAGDLDWAAIGGTWGVATSRLADWERPVHGFSHPHLDDVLAGMASPANKSGSLLANYAARYFEDMWSHFRSLPSVLADGAELHYVVGNSTFFGELLSTELLYADMLGRLGFTDVKCTPLRKRNSKKDLVEFDVSAVWGR